MRYKLGDSVVVKEGVVEPDFEEFEMSGWQGRITNISAISEKDPISITVEWDSITLKQIPADYIGQSERDGYGWDEMTLYGSDLEKASPRDKKEDRDDVYDELCNKCYWFSYGDAGVRISEILDNIDPEDEWECLKRWETHLQIELAFPIFAVITDSENNRSIKADSKVLINSLASLAEIYGIIVSVEFNGAKHTVPLCDLEVIDADTIAYQLIKDYRVWFANR